MARTATKMVRGVSARAKYNGWGDEPKIINNHVDLSHAFAWYSALKTIDDARQWLVEYARANFPDKVDIIASMREECLFWQPNQGLNRTMGWVARMANRGVDLPAEQLERLNAYIAQLRPEKKVVSISKQAARDRLGDFLPDLEQAVDDIDPEFDTYAYLNSKSIPQIYATRIAEYYLPVCEELVAVLTQKGDEQLMEAYAGLSRSDVWIQAKYLINIINDCRRYLRNQKKVRKPRKSRKTSINKFKYFVYMAEHEPLKIKSQNPEAIIGAERLFTLNVKNSVLTMFVAKPGGLDVNRTAITNYDPKLTKSKRVGKKLETVIKTILDGNKKQRNTVLDLVASNEFKSTDRINNYTVLLSIVK